MSEELTPDLIEPLLGWRTWRLGPDGLHSVTTDVLWPAGEPLRATCRAHAMTGTLIHGLQPAQHGAPDRFCRCGVYAVTELHRVTYPGEVFGPVKLWGRVVKAEHGFRAQFAYPERLYVAHPGEQWLTDPVLTQYNVPIQSADDLPGCPVHLRNPSATMMEHLGGHMYQAPPNILYWQQQQMTAANASAHYQAQLIGLQTQQLRQQALLTNLTPVKRKRWWRR